MGYPLIILLIVCRLFAVVPEKTTAMFIDSTVTISSIIDESDLTENSESGVDTLIVEGEKEEIDEEKKDLNQTILVAKISFVGVVIGAILSGLVSVYLAHLNSKEAEKERNYKANEAREERQRTEAQSIKEKKLSVYLDFLQTVNQASHLQSEFRKQGKNNQDISNAQEKIVDQFNTIKAGLQIYGPEEATGSAEKIIGYIVLCEVGEKDYIEELDKFISFIKSDLNIGKSITTTTNNNETN